MAWKRETRSSVLHTCQNEAEQEIILCVWKGMHKCRKQEGRSTCFLTDSPVLEVGVVSTSCLNALVTICLYGLTSVV